MNLRKIIKFVTGILIGIRQIYFYRFRKYKVSVGTDSRKGGKIYDIVKIIVHEKYDPVTQDYDVCVIKLKQPLEFGETINKIELAARFPESGKTVQVSGWGRTVCSAIVTFNIISKSFLDLDS